MSKRVFGWVCIIIAALFLISVFVLVMSPLSSFAFGALVLAVTFGIIGGDCLDI